MTTVEHYAEAFTVTSDHCFRMVHNAHGTGHPTHCPEELRWRGRFQDGTGKWWSVVSCDGHRADLTSVQRIGRAK